MVIIQVSLWLDKKKDKLTVFRTLSTGKLKPEKVINWREYFFYFIYTYLEFYYGYILGFYPINYKL